MPQSRSKIVQKEVRDNKWRRIWRLLHSPAVLLPTLGVGIYKALTGLPTAVMNYGWALGSVIAVLLLLGIAIAIFEFVPWLMEWLTAWHQAVDRWIDLVGQSLKRATKWVSRVFGAPDSR
jgi:hypothetical protein